MAEGDQYITSLNSNISRDQLLRNMILEDANGKPYLNINGSSTPPEPVSVLQPWYDSLSVKPSEGLWTDLKIMADGMNSDGLWGEIDFLSIIAAMETDEQRLRPLFTTSGNDVIPIASPTLNNNGVLGNGTSSYLNLNWNPFLNGVKYGLNDNSFGYYKSTNGAGGRCWIGSQDGVISSSRIILGANYSFHNNNIVSQSTTLVSSSSAGTIAAIGCYRYNSTTFGSNLNGTTINTAGVVAGRVSVNLPNYNFFGCANNNGGTAELFIASSLRAFFMGSSKLLIKPSLLVESAFFSRLNTFFASRGLPIYNY